MWIARSQANGYIRTAMSLLIIALIPLIFVCRSVFLLTMRFRKDQRFFALKHFLILIVAGVIFLGVIFVDAMGALAHHVPTETEIIINNLALWFATIGIFLSVVGSLIAIVRGIMNMRAR